jgi:FMN reductase
LANVSGSHGGFAPFIIGIGGTTRPNSTSERAIAQALAFAEEQGATTELFGGEFICGLPLYRPDRQQHTVEERTFIESIRRCNGVIVSTPGYHGSLSGPIKNVLDLIEDTAHDERPYLTDRAFGGIVTAYGWQACGTSLVALRMIAHALRAWPTPFGAIINASAPIYESDGRCTQESVRAALRLVARQVVEFARWRQAGAGDPAAKCAESCGVG